MAEPERLFDPEPLAQRCMGIGCPNPATTRRRVRATVARLCDRCARTNDHEGDVGIDYNPATSPLPYV